MDKLSMCRVCLVENVQMHCIIGTNLHEVYEKLTEIPFETKDCRPIQVCYICRERLRHCYKLQASCLKSEEVLTHMLNNELNPIPLQDTHMLKISQPIIHVNIAPSQNSLCDDDKIDDNHLIPKPSKMLDYVQVKEELFEDVDNQNIDNNEIINHFGMDIKEEFVLEVDHISVNPIVSETDHTEDIFSETSIKEEIQSEVKDIITEVDNIQPLVPVSEISIPSALNENSTYVSSNLGTIQSIGQFMIEQTNLGITSTIDLPAGTEFYKCDICHKCFNQRNNFYDHVRKHTADKPYQCSVCDKSFRRQQHLVAHTRKHMGEKPYKCDICEKSFAQNSTLKAHRAIHTVDNLPNDNIQPVLRFLPIKTVTLKTQNENIDRSSKVENHTHTGIYKCNICFKCFDHKNKFNGHIRIHTAEKHLITRRRTHTGEKPYKCDICEKSFTQKNKLKAHQGIHTHDKPHVCEICGKGYIDEHNLVNHVRTHNNEKSFQCDKCNKSFSYRDLLIAHIRSQHTEKAFKCDVCDKGFHVKQNLNVHMRIHTGEKPYPCPICDKRFTHKHHLNSHIVIHTVEKRYKCDVCEKYFRRKREFQTHTRLHTSEKPYKCDACDKSYSFKRNLLYHVQTHM